MYKGHIKDLTPEELKTAEEACHTIINYGTKGLRKQQWLVCHERAAVAHSHDIDEREVLPSHIYPYRNEVLIQGKGWATIRWDDGDSY